MRRKYSAEIILVILVGETGDWGPEIVQNSKIGNKNIQMDFNYLVFPGCPALHPEDQYKDLLVYIPALKPGINFPDYNKALS